MDVINSQKKKKKKRKKNLEVDDTEKKNQVRDKDGREEKSNTRGKK